MNKSELIDAIACKADIPKTTAVKVLDAFVESVTEALRNDDQVVLIGFGSFSLRKREARAGRNPRTGETIQIAASNLPTFKPGKALKDAVK